MRFFVSVCAFIVIAVPSSSALSISPTRIVIGHDRGAQVPVRLEGESDALPIELTMLERLPDGALVEVPESIARVQPPQVLLQPGEARTVYLEVSGNLALVRSRSFYLRIEELGLQPVVTVKGSGREIVLLATYLLPVHVLGDHVDGLTAELVSTLESQLIVLSNSGPGVALLSSCRITFFQTTGADIELDGSWLARQVGSDAILPEESIRLDLNAILSGSDVKTVSDVAGVSASCDGFQ